MATPMPRQLYIEQFEKGLLENISINLHEIRKQKLLTEALKDAFSQALSALEDRFEAYIEEMICLNGDESQLMKAKEDILASETSKQKMRITSADRQLHREALKNCFKQIKDVIDLQTTTILDELVSKDILSVSDRKRIRGHGNRMRQNEELLGCITGSISVEDFYNVLLPALKKNHPSLVNTLVAEVERLETEYEEKVCTACGAGRDVQVKCTATNLLSHKHRGLSNSTKWSERKYVPDKAILGCNETAYKMTARPRGICLIINNNEIKGRLTRDWSDIDCENVQRVFTKLEFKVITRTNLTVVEMLSEVQGLAYLDHSKFDAFVCCILTYGNHDGLFGYDGRIVPDSLLTSPFKASQCPTLAGKPKMFFIQTNRIEIAEARPANSQSCIADDADFLFGYCTFPFTTSLVNRLNGSVYICALTRILETHCDRHDLLTCMRMVNQEVAKQKSEVGRKWYEQTPAPVFTLTKDVFLTNNPCWPHVPSE